METEQLREQKERLMEVFLSPQYRPMKLKELAILLDVPKQDREKLQEVLDSLLLDGKIGVSSRGRYGKPEIATKIGIYCGNAKGFGFVKVEGEEEDIYIPELYTKNAMHGDKVQVSVLPGQAQCGSSRHTEGRILRVLERNNPCIVGTFQKGKGFGFVLPDNRKLDKDIFIAAEHSMNAVTGHKVVVKITDYGSAEKNPEGIVTEILGHVNEPQTDLLAVVRAFQIPETFSPEVEAQLRTVPGEVSGEEKAGRLDLRDQMTVTIDGEDAKDLDDAISLRRLEDGYELGVHIADVSHYVKEGDPLDQEAYNRGTSVYLTDRVIPMLPFQLSNGICSLNEGVDRLAFSCIMRMNDEGEIRDYQIAETLIRVDKRMCYTKVAAVLENRAGEAAEEARREYAPYSQMLFEMQELSKKLRGRRCKRGAMDFDFPEAKITVDDAGAVLDIRPYERNCATDLIEDFMLAANETVAEHAYWQQLPFLYRNHESPDTEKMLHFAMFVNNFGQALHVKNNEVHPKELQKLLERIKGTPQEAFISRMLLRSMKQAKYSAQSLGHFGLSARFYTHFTSPIRRYPDLQIHRILKESLYGLSEEQSRHYQAILPEVAIHSSMTERRADEAEREVEKIRKAQYMKRWIGERYEGVISSVTAWGLYVELANTVEGIVHVSDMTGDYYLFDEQNLCLYGENTRREYRLGQTVLVEVDAVDTAPPAIRFRLVQAGRMR